MPKPSRVSKRVKALREKVDLSASELSKLAGLSHGTLSHFERGFVSEMKLSSLARIAAVLGVSTEELLTDSEPTDAALVSAAVERARTAAQSQAVA